MKALTIRQPFASLIAKGEKTVELRTWSTKHRGPLLVHAAKNPDRPFMQRVRLRTSDVPCGVLLCIVDVLDVLPATDADMRAAWDPGVSPEGYFAWHLRLIAHVARTPRRGRLSLWDVPDDEIVRLPTPRGYERQTKQSPPKRSLLDGFEIDRWRLTMHR